MAVQAKLCFAFLLVFHFSLVSCRHDYFHYYSRYVKGESSTESGPSSTTGISTNVSTHISTPESLISENLIPPKENSYSSSNNDVYDQRSRVTVVQSGNYNDGPNDMRNMVLIRWGVTIGCIIFVGLIVCCVMICCPCCCRGKERRGFIINSNVPNQPTPNLIQPQIPQAVAVQHFPPEIHAPQQPPPYDTQPIHQQFQYPSTEHLLQNPTGQQQFQQPMDQQQFQQPMGQQQFQQPMGQQQYQQPLMFQDPNAATTAPPYPTKY